MYHLYASYKGSYRKVNEMKITMLGTGKAYVTECYNSCFVISDENQHFMVDGGGGNGILHDMSKRLLETEQIKGFEKIVRFHEVKDGEERKINGRKVTFFDIQSAKAKQFGFCMDLDQGERLVCCGDEPFNECEKKYVEGSKWLIHEAFCLQSQTDFFKPYEKKHSTVKDVCCLADRLGIQNLILYHTEDMNIRTRKELYTKEGAAYYHGNLYVPDDLEMIEL